MRTKLLLAAAVSLAGLSAPSFAVGRVQTGTFNGVSYTAKSNIVGVTSTATVAGGGDPQYLAQTPFYSGTVGLFMEYSNNTAFVCSGSLLNNRRAILTAAHCVSGGDGVPAAGLTKVTAVFYDGDVTDGSVYNTFFGLTVPGVTTVDVTNVLVNKGYTGEVVDQNDIAVLRLSDWAPEFARSYELSTLNDLTGQDLNVAGFGGRSNAGGDVGTNLGTGRRRQGDNRYDFQLGDEEFDGAFSDFIYGDPDEGPLTNAFGGTRAQSGEVYLTDFDNGLEANDASCVIAGEFFGLSGGKYCNLGRGASEATTAGGDSGGPQFVDGKIASVTSFGLTYGLGLGDIDDDLNDTFGEFGGYVPVNIHLDFINASAAVPEPATWATMMLGFGLVGAGLRRRKQSAVAA